MSSAANHIPSARQGLWAAIVRIFVVEVFVLLLLAGAIVGYLDWSSNVAWAEFNAASKLSAPNASFHPVKGQTPCDRSA